MLNSRLIIDLPYDQASIVTGYADKLKQQSDQYLHLDLLGGSTNLIAVIKAYSDSYNQSTYKTLLDCRDYFVAKALGTTLQSTLFTDNTKQRLTAHAYKAVSTVTSRAVYPQNIKERDQPLAAPFGCLAYYFLYVNPDGYPTEYLTKLLTYIWGLLGISYNTLPKDRITKLFKLIGKTSNLDELATSAIKQVLSAQSGSDLYSALTQARRYFITEADVNDFSLRILTGKYSEHLYPLFAAALPEREYDKLTVYKNNIKSILRPAGFNLLLNALVVEGYLKAANYISGLSDSLTSMALDDFLASETLVEAHGRSIAANLATTYDALDFITTYRLFETVENPDTLLTFIYNFTPPAIYSRDDTRLFTLFNTIDIDKNNRKVFTDSLLKELSELGPVGQESITLSSSTTAKKVGLTATNYSSSSSPVIVFVTSQSTATPQDVALTTSTVSNFTSTSVVADVDSNQSIVAVALTGSRLANGSTINLNELTTLRSDSSPNVSVSNTQVVEATVIPDGLSRQVNDYITDQSTNYYLYNYLTATSRPRGSVNSRYESQGVRPDALDTAQIESNFGYRQEGYLDEYAARMAGLTKQQKEVHINSELKVLEEWANSIKQITDSVAAPPIIDEVVDDSIDFVLD